MITDRTGTTDALQEIDQLLAKEFAGGLSSTTLVVRCIGLQHVHTDPSEMGNQDFHTMVIADNEDVETTFPEERCSPVVEGFRDRTEDGGGSCTIAVSGITRSNST